MGNEPEQVGGKLSPMELDEQIMALYEDDITADQVVVVVQLCKYYKQQIALVNKYAEKAVMDWINEHGEIQYEDLAGNVIRHYVGTVKTTKLRPEKKAEAVMGILEACGGDLDTLAELLASQPLKHGACRKVLPEEQFDELFETVEQEDLKTGKPKKAMITINSRFLKG